MALGWVLGASHDSIIFLQRSYWNGLKGYTGQRGMSVWTWLGKSAMCQQKARALMPPCTPYLWGPEYQGLVWVLVLEATPHGAQGFLLALHSGSLLAVFRGQHGVPGIEPRLAAYKTITLPTVLLL